MVSRANPRIVFSVLLVVAFALTGCGKGTSKSPPKQQVQDAVAVALPPTLSLDSVELEPISTGPESAKVNFKAIVAPKEDLCQVDREVEGTPKITLLKVVQAAGTKMSLYGSVEARRTMDQWTLESPQIQTGLEQLGKPRGAFHSQAYVTGSSEALAALKQQAANLRQQEIERKAQEEQRAREEKARQERQEQARIAIQEQQKKDEEKRRKMEEERRKTEEENAARDKIMLAEKAKQARLEAAKADMEKTAEAARKAARKARENPGHNDEATGYRNNAAETQRKAVEARREYEMILKEVGTE